MNQGVIPIETLDGGFDLTRTLESGQTFLWNRTDGKFFTKTSLDDGEWYYTATNNEIAMVREEDEKLLWQSTDGESYIRNRLGLDDPLTELHPNGDPLLDDALSNEGLRLVNDPVVPCLISFICSSNMRVERIHEMQQGLSKEFGEKVALGEWEFYKYPTAHELANATEGELKELKLGYRAPWVLNTAITISEETIHPQEAATLSYKEARAYLEEFTGVGPKVADCVLLFSLGFTQSIPLDTWIQSAVSKYYPEFDGGSGYDAVTDFLRERWGENAGYKQLYVFEHLRSTG